MTPMPQCASDLDAEQNPPRRFEVSVSGMVHDDEASASSGEQR